MGRKESNQTNKSFPKDDTKFQIQMRKIRNNVRNEHWHFLALFGNDRKWRIIPFLERQKLPTGKTLISLPQVRILKFCMTVTKALVGLHFIVCAFVVCSYAIKSGTRPQSAVSSQSDCIYRCHRDPDQVPYFRGDWSWNYFYGHSPPSDDSRRAVVNSKLKYVHTLKVWLGELSVSTWP